VLVGVECRVLSRVLFSLKEGGRERERERERVRVRGREREREEEEEKIQKRISYQKR